VTDRPAVSVIVPCYNLGAYVEEAVDSVLAQTYTDVEIIVVNDGSTDAATNAVLTALERPRTTVLTTENRGVPAARNHAIAHARGRYVCALDADDTLHPQFLEKTIALLERDRSVAFVSTWVECFGAERWIWRQERCDFPALLAECVVLTASPVRREALDAVGGYDGDRFADGDEDWDLWISLVERGFRGTIVPEVLFHYRQRADSRRRVALQPDIRMRIWRNLLDKHRASYERFLPDVLLLMEDECGRLLLENWRLEHEIESSLTPALAARRAELDRLRATAPAPPSGGEADELWRQLASARAEVAALRQSRSWRVTAPLRLGYEAWLSVRRLASAPRRPG
jgi:glycosyltransferase involved in cell wall biosynthesis